MKRTCYINSSNLYLELNLVTVEYSIPVVKKYPLVNSNIVFNNDIPNGETNVVGLTEMQADFY